MNTTASTTRRAADVGRPGWHDDGRSTRDAVGAARVTRVGVAVDDPDLDADVRAILAALAVDAAPGEDQSVDLVVTDRDGGGDRAAGVDQAGGLSGSGASWARRVRVAPDRAGADDDGTGHEVIRLPSGTGDLVALLMTPVTGRAGSRLVVLGAVGGCGTSTLAAALAIRASPRRRTLLVETDPCGTGLDLLLGVEDEPGLRLQDVRADLGGPDPEALWAAVPKARAGLGLLARSRTADAMAVRALAPDGGAGAMRSHRDAGGLVVSDAGVLSDSTPVGVGDDVVVVTRADLPGAVAAGRAVRRASDAVVVVRTGRGDPLHAADVAGFAGAARWHVLPEIRGVRRAAGSGGLIAALDRGRAGGVRRLGVLADALLDEAGPDAHR
ncbi:chromosome partitioning protein [uncultured Dietzia sp.]|uniref:chromosome partitioning protein n=1 Tax=uncultured Dietzia sp. TaxID=395519 RepID=UPI0025F182A5|nr:chromosome partitioning protein [uncultured Dietzia sp.]